MINEIKGDLLAAKGVIVHGCNAQGVMGSGVAKQIREKWPQAYDEYVQQCKAPPGIDAWRYWPGISIVGVGSGQYVCNMVTQDTYGRDGSKYVKYDWVDRGFQMLADSIMAHQCEGVINFPLIGCGLGGGRWPVVREIIEHRLPDDKFIKNLYVL